MKLRIGDQLIELLDHQHDYSDLNQVQAETYRLLYALACIGEGVNGIREQTLSRLLGLRSPAALRVRLSNLQAKGKIQMLTELDIQTA